MDMILFTMLFVGMLVWGFIGLALKATWGILKLVGIILSVVAFPMILAGIIIVGIGTYLIFPFLLLALAFHCIAKA